MASFLTFLSRAFDFYLGRTRPVDDTLWHKWMAPHPVRLVDGSLMLLPSGQLWRRRANGRWEYKVDPESFEEWSDRQI